MDRYGLPIARGVAIVLAAFMAAYFVSDNFGGDSVWRLNNPFLFPDLLIPVLLAIAVLLPRRFAARALIFSLAWSAAVWSLSLAQWLVDGEVGRGLGHLGPDRASSSRSGPRGPQLMQNGIIDGGVRSRPTPVS